MGLRLWLIDKLSKGIEGAEPVDPKVLEDLMSEVAIREVAFYSAVNLIASAIGKCEFKTFQRGREVKDEEYYLWNVQPNVNQNSSEFIRQWIAQLYRRNECLIIESHGELLVADSFQRTEYAVYEDVFTGVTVKNFTFDRPFPMSEVLYFKLSQRDLNRLLQRIFSSYGNLIAYAMKSYQRTRGSRGLLKIATMARQAPNYQETYDDLMNNRFTKFFNSNNAVMPIFEGFDYEDIGSKTYSNETTRDIRALTDDIYDFTARALLIPPALMRGQVAGLKDTLDLWLTVGIDPLVDLLQEEINRKRNSRAEFLAGTRLQIDTKAIKHVDLLGVATSIEKLISSGPFCINDIRELVGEPPIEEPWAKQHFMTRNYAPIQDVLTPLEGGENKSEG